MDDKIRILREWVQNSENIVFFGGAGVSTESGVPDFRSPDGLYNQKYDHPPETILSHTFFTRHPDIFYKFHREKLVFENVKPNRAHERLAELEAEGKLRAVITQNIDGLHQLAGSKNVFELHGSSSRCYCASCRKSYPGGYINTGEGVPRCDCGGIVRPDVVLYEESLDMDVLKSCMNYISEAEVLIVGGTSLAVYPAAGLINYYKGDKLVLINKQPTPYDSVANLTIADSIGAVLGAV